MSDKRLKHRIARNKRREQRKKQKIRRALCLAFVGALACLGVAYGCLRHYVCGFPQDRILDRVYIGTVDVSGMTGKEAKQAVQEHHQEHLEYQVTMKVEEASAKATLGELGLYHKDVDRLVEEALSYGKEGTVFGRFRQIRSLKKEPAVVKEELKLKKKEAKAVIRERAVPLAVRAEDAYIERSADGEFQIVKEKTGHTVAVAESVKKIGQAIGKNWDHEDITVDLVMKKEEPKVTAADLDTIEDELGSFFYRCRRR
ncbi:peptidoglycan binding domain-containing protein [uncultured Merdimonas sp.]|uniref:peptidoglycan binding domain-containing protein n=1 Tax=uncultured Merdimonas sp. TaxID=2023269 RepID=UPI00320ADA78